MFVVSTLAALVQLGGVGDGYVCTHTVLRDIRRHIEDNWRRSAYARTGVWRFAGWRGRKRHAWNVLVSIEILALAAFVALFVLALAQ
jgi:hypothetical protein